MAFVHYSGPVSVKWYPKKASTAFAVGDLVYADGSGAIQPADSTSGDHLGVIQKLVAATDSVYASTTLVPVLVPQNNTMWLADVGTGTFTAAMVGSRYDLKDANELDVSATSKKVVTIEKYVSATKAVVTINAMVANADVATT
jgi:hypothetical protein